MPFPPFSFSIVFAGNGFIISKIRQIIKERATNKIVLGTKIRLIQVPTTSSKTNCEGSFPYAVSNFEPNRKPITVHTEIANNIIVGFSKPGIKYIKIAAKLPKVPDAYLMYPVKNTLPIIFSNRFS